MTVITSRKVTPRLKASNARQGIKTRKTIYALLRNALCLKASNARQGIKTLHFGPPGRFFPDLRLKASNARQGIKTQPAPVRIPGAPAV